MASSNYDSKYSPGKKISGLKLIIELVCENKAQLDSVELPPRFWKNKEWETYYKSQLRAASKLCKEFGENRVLSFVIKNKIYSLYAKWIRDAISKISDTVIVSNLEVKDSRQSTGLKRGINKLKGLQ